MSVKLTKRGSRIEIRSSEPITGMKTKIPGAYLTTMGIWTVPLSLESCKLLRELFGSRLVVSTELRRWARTVRDNRAYMAELAKSTNAKLSVLPTAAPKLARAMRKRKYQRVGARFIADAGRALIADEPGLGKTLIAMAGILEAEVPGPYLIVAPKTAADSVWRREIERWLPTRHRAITIANYERGQRERRIRLGRHGKSTWLIVHPEIVMVQSFWVCQEKLADGRVCGKRTVEGSKQQRMLSCKHVRDRKTKKDVVPNYPWLFDVEWGAVVVDESHESLIQRSGTKTQRRRGLDLLKLRADGVRLAMSGTPFDSKPNQLWGTLNWLDPETYSAYYRWAELYWQKGGYTGHELGEFRHDREEMLWRSLDGIALRRTKAEVAKDLPPKLEVGSRLDPSDEDSPKGIWLPMEGRQARAYESMERTSVAHLKSGRLEALTALTELTRLKQLATSYGDIYQVKVKGGVEYRYRPVLPSNKFNWTVEALEEWGYPRDPLTKVVIVSMYTGILMAFRRGIERHFKTKVDNPLCTAITGRTPSRRRAGIIERFNQTGRDTPQIMLLNVKAGGTAITLDTADRTIFISETRNPSQQEQAEDRTHRVSNPRQCLYYYLRSLNTVDVGTALINQELARASRRLLDTRRGVEYMRHVLDLSHAS